MFDNFERAYKFCDQLFKFVSWLSLTAIILVVGYKQGITLLVFTAAILFIVIMLTFLTLVVDIVDHLKGRQGDLPNPWSQRIFDGAILSTAIVALISFLFVFLEMITMAMSK